MRGRGMRDFASEAPCATGSQGVRRTEERYCVVLPYTIKNETGSKRNEDSSIGHHSTIRRRAQDRSLRHNQYSHVCACTVTTAASVL